MINPLFVISKAKYDVNCQERGVLFRHASLIAHMQIKYDNFPTHMRSELVVNSPTNIE